MTHFPLRRVLGVLFATAVVAAIAPAALAAPRSPQFGPHIDATTYQAQSTCSPSPKPGVEAFRKLVMDAYPNTGYGYISRACHIGATSEHKEGRAWDWMVDANNTRQRAAADDLIGWLTTSDGHGNPHAMARRTGIMYLIWNRKIWSSSSGWRVYCEQKSSGCISPRTGSFLSPHTDHVHFSFTWDGARKRTTFYKKGRSMVAAIVSRSGSTGYWLAGRNGGVLPFGVSYFGGRGERYRARPVVAMAARPAGDGYWLAYRNGRIAAFGAAPHRGGALGKMKAIVGLAATPTGNGYWLVNRRGRVMAFGNAKHYGRARGVTDVAGIAATPTGAGYRLFSSSGATFSFGDAVDVGDRSAKPPASPVVGGITVGTTGYRVALANGKVLSFGDAPRAGPSFKNTLGSRVAGIAPSKGGPGYLLVTKLGKVITAH